MIRGKLGEHNYCKVSRDKHFDKFDKYSTYNISHKLLKSIKFLENFWKFWNGPTLIMEEGVWSRTLYEVL